MPYTINGVLLSEETVSYLESVLWAETVNLPCAEDELVDGCMDVDEDHPLHGIHEYDPLDRHFDISDFTAESLRKAQGECTRFFGQLEEMDLLTHARSFADDDTIAHDFWLTRNGHGAGFWDGDYADKVVDIGDALSKVATGFGELWPLVDENGCIHIED
jgi:hypothetical protein